MTEDLTKGPDHEVAIAAARAGAAVLREMYGTEMERELKTGIDFATDADLAAERAILGVIRRARPGDGFVGEELGARAAREAGRLWLVDPLCGTLNFAARTSAYSVNVALTVRGNTTAAAVSHPPSGEVYWAHGTHFGILGPRGSAPPPTSRLVDINADGPLDHPFVGAQLAADPDFRSRFGPRVESTTLALAWVATGQRLGYITDGVHRGSVHFTAGIALCRAAGRVITDFNGDAVHTGPGIVAAADPETHTSLLAMISKHRQT